MQTSRMDKVLLVAGAGLFLAGLLQGGIVDRFTNPRMALSAHLTAVQCGTALMVVGGIWQAVSLSRPFAAFARWSIIAGMVGLWAGLTLAAVSGASRVLPIAGAGFAAEPATETLVAALILLSSGAMIGGWLVLLVGLVRSRDAP